MPGSLCRFGPAKLTGDTRDDQTGSTRMLSPPVWISQLACPTKEAHPAAIDPLRRGVGMRVRNPVRPGRPLPLAAELPAQHLTKRFRRRPVRIEEVQAVEMVRGRSVVGLHAGHPEGGNTDQSPGSGKQSEKAAAGDRHGQGF